MNKKIFIFIFLDLFIYLKERVQRGGERRVRENLKETPS